MLISYAIKVMTLKKQIEKLLIENKKLETENQKLQKCLNTKDIALLKEL